jgi:hypothetical protein
MSTCDFIKAGVDIGTGAAALIGAGVAVAGLRTWRAQLRGKTEYELARRLLRGVFEIRDQVASVRNPFISGEEMAAAFKEVGVEPKEGDMMRDKRTNGFVYQQRWKGLSKALSDVRVDVLEAEVLWGEPVRDADKALRFCIAELNVSLTMYLRAMNDERPMSKQIGEQIEKYSKVIYQLSDDPAEDLFTGKVSDAVKRFETLLRPHLTLGLRSSNKKAI